MPNLRVAVDVGGTFTDICILDEGDGEVQVGKVPSTADPIEASWTASSTPESTCATSSSSRHGTTVATNALITRNLPPAAMVTTRHFRDVIEIRRGTKRRPLGRLQRRRTAVHPPSRPVRGDRADRPCRRGGDAARRGRRAARGGDPPSAWSQDGRGLLHQRSCQSGSRAADAGDSARRNCRT